MKFGANGELFVAVYGQGDVTVLGASGAVVRRIKTAGKRPTNVAFGPAGESRVYVTEVELGALEVHEAETDGLPLFG
jgi:sugar lactone lactonase YvrE